MTVFVNGNSNGKGGRKRKGKGARVAVRVPRAVRAITMAMAMARAVRAMARARVRAARATRVARARARARAARARAARAHQKQHDVPYDLSIVFFLSLKYAFGIISMFFTLVRCSIILSRLFLTYLHLCFLPYVQIYQISVRLLMSHEKCSIWQVLFILKFGTFTFFFRIVLYSLQIHNVLLQMSKMSHPFFPFCLILLVSTVRKSLSCQVSHFFLTVPIP